jgi:pimeloyl-ACP methyl ester carboxylesterase
MPSILIKQKYIYYTDDAQTEGDAPRTTTVFIHGLGSSSCFYKTIIPTLTKVTRCIALDTRGSGQSPLGGLHQSIESIARDVASLLDALGIQEVFVVGHSMGGTVASALASIDRRAKGVVLLGPINPSAQLTGVFEKRGNAVHKGSSGPMIHWGTALFLRSCLKSNGLCRWT